MRPSADGDLLEHGLEPLLELAAVLRAGQQRAEVERPDAPALEALGHVAGDDALGEALDDRRLADAGLADQHRVVLGAAREHLHRAAHLVVAPDHGVELAALGDRREIAAEARERVVALLGVLVVGASARRAALRGLEQRGRARRRRGRAGRRARAAGARRRRTGRRASRASLRARSSVSRNASEGCCVVVAPLARRQLGDARSSACARTASRSAPAPRSSTDAVASGSAVSASSRWSGVISGLPSARASSAAAASASRARIVN